MTASVERGGLGPGSLRGAGFLAVCWSSGVSYGPGSGGIGRGGVGETLFQRGLGVCICGAAAYRVLVHWCCVGPCLFGSGRVGPGDHVAQLGFLFPPMGPWSLCCSVVGWL